MVGGGGGLFGNGGNGSGGEIGIVGLKGDGGLDGDGIGLAGGRSGGHGGFGGGDFGEMEAVVGGNGSGVAQMTVGVVLSSIKLGTAATITATTTRASARQSSGHTSRRAMTMHAPSRSSEGDKVSSSTSSMTAIAQ